MRAMRLVRSEKHDIKTANSNSIIISSTNQEPPQVCQAIGDIVRQTEKTPNNYTYVEFLFGVLDYAGLKYIENYHTATTM